MTRAPWLIYLDKMVRLPLTHAAAGNLRAALPGPPPQNPAAPLEMMSRVLAGIGPWLDSESGGAGECSLRGDIRSLTLRALATGTHPDHKDFWGFGEGDQSLVDAAFLGQFLLRAPRLTASLSDNTRQRLLAALLRTRPIIPCFNNWLLFSACVEAAIHVLGGSADRTRVDYALRQHEQWYLGDAHYADGPFFHADYYNSFVIQPMMLDVLETFVGTKDIWNQLLSGLKTRLTRYAAVQERMIAADGSWPPIGRSLTYRCGAFHALSTAAWKGLLPESLPPAQVRCALHAALARCLDAPGTWTSDGWLTRGLCGDQPALAESYICTSSVYLASFVFPVLGLPADHPLWTEGAVPWTQVRIWERSENIPADKALSDRTLF